MTKPRRIVFFVPSLGGGGAEMQVLRLANHLDRQRYQVAVVVARGGGTYETQLRPDVALQVLLPRWAKSSTLSMIMAIPALHRVLGREKPDILCSLLPHTNGVCALALRGLPERPWLVAGVQNNVTRDLASQANIIMRWLNRECLRFYQQADQIVALSRGVADDLARHFPELASKTKVIYNAGVDDRVRTLVVEPMERARPASPLVVACGRLSEQKDFPTLLRAFARVIQRHPAQLWILGRGPEEIALRALAAELGLAKTVHFLGFQSNPFAYMAMADVFVLSSKWEGFGNVLVEAMASGTAVVSTRCDFGPPEILTHERDGLLCAVGDVGDMAAQIERLLDDPDLRNRIAASGRERARDFDAQRIADAYGEALAV